MSFSASSSDMSEAPKTPPTDSKLKLRDEPDQKSKLHPLPDGWVRQYDIIHKRYFYIHVRNVNSPVSAWRFPAGSPVMDETQSREVYYSFHPPPLARKSVESQIIPISVSPPHSDFDGSRSPSPSPSSDDQSPPNSDYNWLLDLM